VPLGEVTRLIHRGARDGELPLSEGKRVDLEHGGRTRFLAVMAREQGAELVGYAQASLGQKGWELETVIDPALGVGAPALRLQLVLTALPLLHDARSQVHYWVAHPGPGSDAALDEIGFRADREQLQMRVALPLAPQVRRGPAIAVRTFRTGRDEHAWLSVNNRAFAGHPEQGAWDLRTLRDRETQPWFDPSGFLLHEVGGRLAGSCWTKEHRDTDPPIGEIYVISVDPDFHGRGLGRALAVTGLDWLCAQGFSIGMLYTDAANAAAVGLYESLGFTVHRRDRVYTLDAAALR
jgi:mycothiol synthase